MILQALTAYYDRVAAQDADAIAPPGFSYEPISFVIVLDRDGNVVDVNDERWPDAKGKPQAQPRLVPQPPKRSGKKPPPCFLWDKTAFSLGVEATDKEAVKAGAAPYTETADYFARFKDAHEQLAKSDDAGLGALGRFLATWQPSSYAALRYAADMIDRNVVFRLDDDDHRFIHDRPAAKALWQSRRARVAGDDDAAPGICLVTGSELTIARLHPAIKGVRGAQQAGGSIVSFNQAAFASYGKDQGFNAPVSEAAAFAYTTALNQLLRRGGNQKVIVGDATTVYWAEAATPAEARAAEEVGGVLFQRADEQATAKLRTDVMERLEAGRGLEHPQLKLDPGTRFYILGLAPNQARLSIRFWEATTLGDLGRAFHQHFRDLRMETARHLGPPPSLWLLTLCTAPSRRDANGKPRYGPDDIPKPLAGELLRAILNDKRPYPATLLTTLVMRIRSDGHIDSLRASLLKACLVRRMRLEERLPNPEYMMRSDPNDETPPRRLGRLFAVLERAQACALGGDINSTIKDKYLGAAAATPAQVFVGLYKNSIHHIARLRKGHSDAKWIKDANAARRTGYALDRDIGLLWGSFEDVFPAQLSVEDQALFFVGYFQERYGGRPDPEIGAEPNVDIHSDTLDETDGTNETEE